MELIQTLTQLLAEGNYPLEVIVGAGGLLGAAALFLIGDVFGGISL